MGSFQHLTKRLVFFVPLICILVLLVCFSHLLFMKFVIFLVLLVLVNFSLYEFAYLAKESGEYTRSKVLLVLASLFVVAHFFSQVFLGHSFYLLFIFIFLFVSFIITFSFIQGGINHLSYNLFGLIYIVVPLCFLLDILLFIPSIDNKIWFVYIIAVAKFSDIGGYFFGKWLGSHLMAKNLSPKKTVEGAVFALVFSVGASLLLKLLFDSLGYATFEYYSYLCISVLGLVVGVFALLGDLSESLIKRDANIKHSSPFSSFGGALDLIDSLVFCLPFMYFYLEYIK